ncbi:MAG: hypothetical protein HYZ19_02865 [Rhodocyclales bacterium]|nr:hypothetical protein [Rhodocyclales bacterium]
MKKTSLLAAGLAAAFLSLTAAAQPGAGPGPKQPAPVDCRKARDPAQCEARQKAREACKDKKGAAYRQCVQDNMPPPDCSKARNPQRCEAGVKAREACKGKVGRERRQCMREQLKPAAAAAKKS